MAVVKDYRIGNTRIRIADDYCRQDKEEIDRILQNVAQIAVARLSREGEEHEKQESA